MLTSSPFFKLAYSGLISIKSEIDFLVLFTAFASKIFPISYKTITITLSIDLPTKQAPITDIVISVFSSNTLFLNTWVNAFLAVFESNIISEIIVVIITKLLKIDTYAPNT